jgi:threonine dehydratase
MTREPTLPDIRVARELIAPHIHRTPVLTSTTLNREHGAQLFFKCENLQKVGAFKARGATFAVLSAPEADVRGGVVTHSSGNHAAALARAASIRGVPGHIVMPSNAPKVKQDSVRRYGGQITFCEPTIAAREAAAAKIQAETGAMLVHPYDDWAVITGQGTCAVELLEEIPDLDLILAPVGGGGLTCGTSIAAKALRPGIRVFGAEPAGADDAFRSLQTGVRQPQDNPLTIADGLRVALGEKSFSVLTRLLDGIVTVSEDAITSSMRHTWEVMKIIIEPSSAVPLGALQEGKLDVSGKRVGIILTGGNVDLDRLPWQH